ncbi:protein kinase domain-containing protein [Rubritalea tangerina]|uniref:Protein kinase n=1 Tax=Rubritalea tangerina TaxID=430798 RepID=A0ABW4ZF53_9BACT
MRDENSHSVEGHAGELGVTDDDALQLMALALGEHEGLGEGASFGDYQILGELGSGGMGVVYRAREKDIDREVALKVLVAGRFSSRELRQRFLLEYRTVAQLEHRSIVPIYAVGEVDGLPFMAMRLIDGDALDVFMRRKLWGGLQYARQGGYVYAGSSSCELCASAWCDPPGFEAV